jgi:hypothetical protein
MTQSASSYSKRSRSGVGGYRLNPFHRRFSRDTDIYGGGLERCQMCVQGCRSRGACPGSKSPSIRGPFHRTESCRRFRPTWSCTRACLRRHCQTSCLTSGPNAARLARHALANPVHINVTNVKRRLNFLLSKDIKRTSPSLVAHPTVFCTGKKCTPV